MSDGTRAAIDGMRHEALMAVGRELTISGRAEEILNDVVETNPHLRGARVEDVLDIADDTDSYLRWTEPFYEAHHADRLRPQLGFGGSHLPAFIVTFATLACAIEQRAVPEPAQVSFLAQRAASRLRAEGHGLCQVPLLTVDEVRILYAILDAKCRGWAGLSHLPLMQKTSALRTAVAESLIPGETLAMSDIELSEEGG